MELAIIAIIFFAHKPPLNKEEYACGTEQCAWGTYWTSLLAVAIQEVSSGFHSSLL